MNVEGISDLRDVVSSRYTSETSHVSTVLVIGLGTIARRWSEAWSEAACVVFSITMRQLR